MSLEAQSQEFLEIIVRECLGSIDEGNTSGRSMASFHSVISIDSDYLKGAAENEDKHEVPRLSNVSVSSSILSRNGPF